MPDLSSNTDENLSGLQAHTPERCDAYEWSLIRETLPELLAGLVRLGLISPAAEKRLLQTVNLLGRSGKEAVWDWITRRQSAPGLGPLPLTDRRSLGRSDGARVPP